VDPVRTEQRGAELGVVRRDGRGAGVGSRKRGDRAGHLAYPVRDAGAALDGFGVGEFELPEELEAVAPPEERGRAGRDDVRLLLGRFADASDGGGPRASHHAFRDLPRLLEPGDVLVVNTSATLPAAVDGQVTGTGEQVVAHFSTRRSARRWVVELRSPDGRGSTRQRLQADAPVRVRLTGGGVLTQLAPLTRAEPLGGPAPLGRRAPQARTGASARGVARLWTADFAVADPLAYLATHGRAIRYAYTDTDRPLAAYQTVFARSLAELEGPPTAGSAEMPSAARPFTAELVAQLVSRGVQIVPITLHTGVASVEAHEPPYPEWFEVPGPTARAVEAARRAGSRVVAVGTTAVRALESAADPDGTLRAASGWTGLVITPERGVRVVDGLLTGLHEPRASHLLMLEAIAGRPLLDLSYAEALRERYLWHEFGDLHLLLAR
jgi:S-adenosylmethionine:tRNA ribosyltransferase-isomerase